MVGWKGKTYLAIMRIFLNFPLLQPHGTTSDGGKSLKLLFFFMGSVFDRRKNYDYFFLSFLEAGVLINFSGKDRNRAQRGKKKLRNCCTAQFSYNVVFFFISFNRHKMFLYGNCLEGKTKSLGEKNEMGEVSLFFLFCILFYGSTPRNNFTKVCFQL